MSELKFYLPTLCLILVSFTVAAAQDNKCSLKRDQAPELRGFRLGMSIPEAKDKLSWSWSSDFEKADEIGVKEIELSPAQLKDKDLAKGINKLTLEFLDDRLSYIEIRYEGSVKWDSIDQFVAKISEALKLPNVWEESISSSGTVLGNTVTATGKKLVCSGFNVGIILTNTNQALLLMGEANLRATKDQRRQALKEKRQQTFKP